MRSRFTAVSLYDRMKALKMELWSSKVDFSLVFISRVQ